MIWEILFSIVDYIFCFSIGLFFYKVLAAIGKDNDE